MFENELINKKTLTKTHHYIIVVIRKYLRISCIITLKEIEIMENVRYILINKKLINHK